MGYDIKEWVKRNLGKDPDEMLAQSIKDHASLKRIELERGTKPDGFYEYQRLLNNFIFFMINRRKPSGALDPFKPILHDWLDRNLIEKSLLDQLF